MMDSVHSDWRPRRHVCYTESLATLLAALAWDSSYYFFLFSNFISRLFTEMSAQVRPSKKKKKRRSQDRDKATSIKILFNTETDRTCPLIIIIKKKTTQK